MNRTISFFIQSCVLLGLLLTYQLGLTAPKIHEVQPYPSDAPTNLVIWGTGFEDPAIYFGTHPDPLVISADQSACTDMEFNPSPPLDPTDFQCIVTDLPYVTNGTPAVPSGDYLLKIVVEGQISVCGEKPSSLTFLYEPSDCSGINYQDNATCSGDMTGAIGGTDISVFGKDSDKWYFSPVIFPGENIKFSPDPLSFNDKGRTWGNQLNVEFNENGLTQSIGLHTSCSQPLNIGDVFGSFVLVDFEGSAGLPSDQIDLYDLTLGATGPEGAQGPQGKVGAKGDAGDQGPQGKVGAKGDAGDQGPQGKVGAKGDAGDQGPQGKIGPAGTDGQDGAQGPQGKIGPAGIDGQDGAQGPQGKVGAKGDAGDQGPQGKVGPAGTDGQDGAQGPQGKIGPSGTDGQDGAQGPQGKVGAKGDAGDQGPQGKVGPAGTDGQDGAQGPQGKIGPAGTDGQDGAQGPQGKVGAKGDAGDQGPQGKVGAKGDAGDQGPQGKVGAKGDAGDQGPQGKVGAKGDAGDQGPQGKIGPAGQDGAQGPQGKAGPSGQDGSDGQDGAQGPQGKIGPAGTDGQDGSQGPQGKMGLKGDAGDQGPQGKLGPQGSQGPQGKAGPTGDTGAQGPQGKVGPQGQKGDPGDDGIGTNLMCFSTDQTIGTQGKYMGLGQQAGAHDGVGVISPFPSGAEVVTLVVKAAQGNNANSGRAVLYHDAAGGAQGGEPLGTAPNNQCILTNTPVKSVCKITFATNNALELFDSLSVFIKTNGGSFEGGSACILIDPVGSN